MLNTANKIVVKYGFKWRNDASDTIYGFLDLNIVRRCLTDEQYNRISELLNTKRDDGKTYELVCTKFFYDLNDISPIIPCELKVVLVKDESNWFVSDEVVETFELSNISAQGRKAECNEMSRNIVPKDFFLPDQYEKDYIHLLTDEQRKKPIESGLHDRPSLSVFSLFGWRWLMKPSKRFNVPAYRLFPVPPDMAWIDS